MKKLAFLLVAGILCSCKANIDKKITVTEYAKAMAEIKKESKEYSEADFKKANKNFQKHAFSAMANPAKELSVTYKELLEEAKTENTKEKAEIDRYNKEIEKARNLFSITVPEGQYVDLSTGSYPDRYAMMLKVKNHTSKIITGIKGRVVLKNEKGEQLFTLFLEKSADILPQQEIKSAEHGVILPTDNKLELKTLPFSKIKAYWFPELIIYKDGERVELPQQPIVDIDK